MSSPALRALTANAVDYAGLFPPATLPLEQALENHASYVRSSDAWMLGTFILPVAQFDAAAPHFELFDDQHPLRISALGPKTTDASAFREALAQAANAISQLRSDNIHVEQFEMALPNESDAALVHEISERFRNASVRTFWEAPPDRAEETILLIREQNRSRSAKPLGFKLRTGGVTADAFPSSRQIARAIVAAAKHDVPIKFTAGLHHPIRMFRVEVNAKMHGFLNVLGAAVFAREEGWTADQAVVMLDDENPHSFSFGGDTFAWRDHEISAARIAQHRDFVTSFGSCSFDEPREDLRALNLL